VLARLLLTLCLILMTGCASLPDALVGAPPGAALPPVILISIDGLRPQALGRGETPNLDALARRPGAMDDAFLPNADLPQSLHLGHGAQA
jgi:hypothetical protein